MPETEPQADPWKLCGTTIENKYRIASVVGDGGFGVVYRGVHKGFGELIAVKCLKLPRTLDDEQREGLLEQLRDEGKLLHRLSKLTSGIVQALDVGAFTTEDGSWVPYLVLEWLEGETLAEHLKARHERGAGAYSLADAMKLLEPAARALAVAHKQKIAHRDVKPPNLFVTRNNGEQTLKVLDFGIAKVLTDYPTFSEALEATKAGPTAFTPRYGAPEQFNKQRGASGPWTDVFALALILVELITGKKALDGDDPTQLYIAAADPAVRPTPRGRGAVVTDAVEQVLEKALTVEPKYRYADAGEFWDALVAAAKDAPLLARAPSSSSARDALMGTAEFAARAKLDVSAEGQRSASKLPLEPTLPAESKAAGSNDVSAAMRGTARDEGATARGESSPPPAVLPPVQASPRQLSTQDPMAETPRVGRKSSPPSPRVGKAAAPRELAVPAKASRSIWPWLALGLASVAGAVGAFVLVGSSDPGHTAAHPSAKAVGSVRAPAPKSSARASAPASASAPAIAPPPASASAAVDSSASAAPEVAPPPEDMVLIGAGTFSMGEGTDKKRVTISRAFYLDRSEVTVRAFQVCVDKRLCSAADHVSVSADADGGDAGSSAATREYEATWTRRCNAPERALDQPVNCVDFASAEGYCAFRGRRLPTEAEWELAARGLEGRPFPWGREPPECGRACYDKNGACRRAGESVATCAAGAHPADRTPDGIFDLGGNLSEWVSDGFEATLAGGTDPKGAAGAPLKVVRGGSFFDAEDHLRASFRSFAAPVMAHATLGFRCAMDGPPSASAPASP
jgi:formylglycine-generating enzyme required for sulfatase activity/serine/threonine protein kinase